jgi:hypothetical protein
VFKGRRQSFGSNRYPGMWFFFEFNACFLIDAAV